MLNFLVDAGKFDINVQDGEGNTPLHVACSGKPSARHEEAMNVLLQAGASPLVRNNFRKTAIEVISGAR